MQYTTKFKRLVSCLLVFVMLLGMIPLFTDHCIGSIHWPVRTSC